MQNIDSKDRLILALASLLRAERETRGALEAALENDDVSPETLRAILSDPVPVITQEDVDFAEKFAMSRYFSDINRNAQRALTEKGTQ
ncbi:hypothetical protein [Ochrobactrum sp. BTU1]|uniref:hypothetical protein n=1 Tax=Ochrobactrum sp. BTU1 TaxID=2840456 RepID=UPI001C05D72B|nr:hypothetical protein KMS41_26590 [Ochrobactrum sp. BTU1]